MATYTQCDEATRRRVQKITAMYHPELAEAGVTFNLLFAAPTSEDAPAISAAGYKALAQIKIVSLKDRVAGLADATILFDEPEWVGAPDARKDAIIDHELTHLELKLNKFAQVKTDDAGRPKLSIRLHDFHHGGFFDIVRRHQMAAVEAEAVEEVHKRFQQGFLFASLES
jgi:hypothetical protein